MQKAFVPARDVVIDFDAGDVTLLRFTHDAGRRVFGMQAPGRDADVMRPVLLLRNSCNQAKRDQNDHEDENVGTPMMHEYLDQEVMFLKAAWRCTSRRSVRQSACLVGFSKAGSWTQGERSIRVKRLFAGPPDRIALPFDLNLCFQTQSLPSCAFGQRELCLSNFAW